MLKQLIRLLILLTFLSSCKHSITNEHNQNVSIIEVTNFNSTDYSENNIIEEDFYTYKFIFENKQSIIKTPIYYESLNSLTTYKPYNINISEDDIVTIFFDVPGIITQTFEITIDFRKEIITQTKNCSYSYEGMEISYDTINQSIKKNHIVNDKSRHFMVLDKYKYQNYLVGASNFTDRKSNQIILIDSTSFNIKKRYYLGYPIESILDDGGPTLILNKSKGDSVIRVENFIDEILVNGKFIRKQQGITEKLYE